MKLSLPKFNQQRVGTGIRGFRLQWATWSRKRQIVSLASVAATVLIGVSVIWWLTSRGSNDQAKKPTDSNTAAYEAYLEEQKKLPARMALASHYASMLAFDQLTEQLDNIKKDFPEAVETMDFQVNTFILTRGQNKEDEAKVAAKKIIALREAGQPVNRPDRLIAEIEKYAN